MNDMTNEELDKVMKSLRNDDTKGNKFIDEEDEIDFKCNRCGQCCTGRNDIILTPYDVYNIAAAKNILIEEVIDKYIGIHIGNNSNIPILTLNSDDRDMCPFLKFSISEGKFECGIDDNKPGSCRMHPIGIVRNIHKDTGEEKKHFMMTPPCPNHSTGHKVKVKDFVKPYIDHIEEHDAGAYLQFEIIKYIDCEKLVKTLINIDKEYIKKNITDKDDLIGFEMVSRMPSEKISKITEMAYLNGYINSVFNFDMSRPFLEQIPERIKELQDMAVKLITSTKVLGINIETEETRTLISEDVFNNVFKDLENKRENITKEMIEQCNKELGLD